MKAFFALLLLIFLVPVAFSQNPFLTTNLPQTVTAQDQFAAGIQFGPVTFATLPGVPVPGLQIFCTDCQQQNPCVGSGNGAMAQYINGAWSCSAGGGGGSGTITGITTSGSSGLQGGGTSGTLVLSLITTCSPNQVLTWSGSAWACANTGSGTVTGATSGGGLVASGTTLGMLASCSNGQVLAWNGASW